MRRWFKKDIARMNGFLDTLWLIARPADWTADHAARFLEALTASARLQQVAHGLRSQITTSVERERVNIRTAEAWRKFRAPDVVDRFTRMAAEEAASRAKVQAILVRVESEGLPPDVLEHDPTYTRPLNTY